jgi:hypothetical protein
MAIEERFTELPTTSSAQMSDIICAVQNYVSPSNLGLSVQETLQQVFNLFNSNVILSNAGDPNGVVAGQTFQLLWDTTDQILWVCTTSGTTTTAVWTPNDGPMTNGQLLVGSTGASPVRTTLTAGANISITNGAGSITITATGLAGFSWTTVTGTSQAMLGNNGYISNNAGLVTLTLPATSSVGDEIDIIGQGAGGWSIAQGAGQQIIIGNTSSTVGAGGSVVSTNRRDSLQLICTTANTEWTALGAPQSLGLTIV